MMTIKNDAQLIRETKKYFGKNRVLLQNTLKNFNFDERYEYWEKYFDKYGSRKISISYRIFKDFSEWLINKDYKKIDWSWIGDLSWDVEIVLNREVQSHFDFDKKLAANCKNNIMRHLNIYISDIIPAYTIDTFFGFYKDNIYEYGPLKLTEYEKKLIGRIKNDLKTMGYYFVRQKTALQKFKTLRSDLNSDGNASVFDCLFNDLDNYTTDYIRFNDKDIVDSAGIESGWREYYDSKRRLIKTEYFRWFKSREFEKVEADKDGNVIFAEFIPKNRRPMVELNLGSIKKKNKNKYSVKYK